MVAVDLLWLLNFGSSVSVISSSKINMLTTLFLPVVGNYKIQVKGGTHGITFL
jgi:hypothetical protein